MAGEGCDTSVCTVGQSYLVNLADKQISHHNVSKMSCENWIYLPSIARKIGGFPLYSIRLGITGPLLPWW